VLGVLGKGFTRTMASEISRGHMESQRGGRAPNAVRKTGPGDQGDSRDAAALPFSYLFLAYWAILRALYLLGRCSTT
jgi:hypothetical protein